MRRGQFVNWRGAARETNLACRIPNSPYLGVRLRRISSSGAHWQHHDSSVVFGIEVRKHSLHRHHANFKSTTLAGNAARGMGRLTIFLVIILMLAVFGGCLVLAYWNFPVPSVPYEKVLPDARFPK
jgi:hypothetical protein